MRVPSTLPVIIMSFLQPFVQASIPSENIPTLAACRAKLEMYERHVIEQLAVLLYLESWAPSSIPLDRTQQWRDDVQKYDSTFSHRLASTLTQFVDKNNVHFSGSTSTLEDVCGARARVGIDVAQAKFSSDPMAYRTFASRGDSATILALITNEAVEAAILARVRSSARDFVGTLGASTGNDAESINDFSKMVELFFKEILIPLTKDLEVSVLLQLSLEPANEVHEKDFKSSVHDFQ